MIRTPAGKPSPRPDSKAQPTDLPQTTGTRAKTGTPRVTMAQLQGARLNLLGTEQAGPRRDGPHDITEQDFPPTGAPPLGSKDDYPLKDLKRTVPNVDMFWDQRVKVTNLGAGVQNKVFLVQGEDRDGSQLQLAFKPCRADTGRGLAHQLMRNVLAYRVDQLLGFGVIVPACMQEPSGDDKASVGGLFMARATGDLAADVADAHPGFATSPALCREMVKLDVVDYLLQADDRIGNYLIDHGTDGKFKVTGIDNDVSFLDLPAGEPEDHLSVLDTDMASAVLKLTRADLQSVIPPGILTQPQMSRLLDRLDALQTYVQSERDNHRLINPSDWAQHARNFETGLMAGFSGRPQNPDARPGDDGMQDDAMQDDDPMSLPTGRISPDLLKHFDVPQADR